MDTTNQGEVNVQQTGHLTVGPELVDVTVDYLPAPKAFHQKYGDETVVETVRTDAMGFFGVKDFQDRNIHKFFLEFEGRLLNNPGETLEQLLGPHRRGAHFNLVEQVTQGRVRNACELPGR